MTRNSVVFFLCVIFWLSNINSLIAQDVHFSQYYTSPVLVNPGATGAFNEDYRFAIQYRCQWQRVPVDYRTVFASFDGQIDRLSFQNGYFSGGLVLFYDLGGDGNMSYINSQGSFSYTRQLSDNQFISIGTSLALGQRKIDYRQLTFGEQFNGDIFIATNSSTESLGNQSKAFLDLSTGINWHMQDTESGRFGLDLGIAIFHLNRPNISFYENEKTDLLERYTATIVGKLDVSAKLGVMIHGLYQHQQAYQEALSGLILKYHVFNEFGRKVQAGLGLNYRWSGAQDAVIPNILLVYNELVINLSYDINLSDFSVATDRRGGVELGMQYYLTKVKSLDMRKPCPLF